MIRKAYPADLDRLAAIERSASLKFHHYLGTIQENDEPTLAPEILASALEQKTLWIAENKKSVIGFLAAVRLDMFLHIEELSVVFDCQGQGWGKALLSHAIKESRQMGHSGVSLTTDKEIPWNAAFYARHDFKEISLIDCPASLAAVLLRDKARSPKPENRIAMIHE